MTYMVKVEKLSRGGGVVLMDSTVEPAPSTKSAPVSDLEKHVAESWKGKRVDFVIVARGAPHDAMRCARAVRDTTPDFLEARLTVVDAGADPFASGALREAIPRDAQFLKLAKPAGYLPALHVALKETDGEWIFVLDPRVLPTPGWIEAILWTIRSPRVALVAPWTSKRIPMPSGWNYRDTALAVYRAGPDRAPQVPLPGGSCFAIRRLALESIGGFDVKQYSPGYGEMEDAYMRLAHAKWVAVRACRAWVLDRSPGPSDASEWLSEGQSDAGHQRFLVRWGDRPRQEYRARVEDSGLRETAAAMLAAKDTEERPRVVFTFRELAVCGLTLSAVHICNHLVDLGWDATVAYTRLAPGHSLRHFPTRFAPVATGDTGAHVRWLARLPRGTRVVATTWRTVHDLEAAIKSNSDLVPVYYVQDDERTFRLPNGRRQNNPEEVAATFGKVRNLVANSSWVRLMLDGLGHKNVTRIGIGVDTEMFRPSTRSSKRPRVMVHCRPSTPRRGWPFIAQVINRAAMQVDFEVVGYDEEWGEGELTVSACGNLGRLSPEEVAREMSTAHVFFGGSSIQGWGMPELEAMAAGCALVCTDNRGIHDFATDGVDCALVKHGDVDGAARTLARVVGDAKVRRRLGQAARKGAMRFDWRVVAVAWDRYLKERAK